MPLHTPSPPPDESQNTHFASLSFETPSSSILPSLPSKTTTTSTTIEHDLPTLLANFHIIEPLNNLSPRLAAEPVDPVNPLAAELEDAMIMQHPQQQQNDVEMGGIAAQNQPVANATTPREHSHTSVSKHARPNFCRSYSHTAILSRAAAFNSDKHTFKSADDSGVNKPQGQENFEGRQRPTLVRWKTTVTVSTRSQLPPSHTMTMPHASSRKADVECEKGLWEQGRDGLHGANVGGNVDTAENEKAMAMAGDVGHQTVPATLPQDVPYQPTPVRPQLPQQQQQASEKPLATSTPSSTSQLEAQQTPSQTSSQPSASTGADTTPHPKPRSRPLYMPPAYSSSFGSRQTQQSLPSSPSTSKPPAYSRPSVSSSSCESSSSASFCSYASGISAISSSSSVESDSYYHMPPPAPPTVLAPPPPPSCHFDDDSTAYDRGEDVSVRSRENSRLRAHEPFLSHAEPPRGSDIRVETCAREYKLVVRLPGFQRDAITLSTRRRRVLHIVADSWEPGGGHLERRVAFGYDADLSSVRAQFDGEHLQVTVPRRVSSMSYM